jgi:hypothetical protein
MALKKAVEEGVEKIALKICLAKQLFPKLRHSVAATLLGDD